MNITTDVIPGHMIDDVSVRLILEAMLDKNIYSGDTDGLDAAEVRSIVEDRDVHRILLNGQVVGTFNPGTVHISNYWNWILERGVTYQRIGFIYIDKAFRNLGIGAKVLGDHVAESTRYAECCEEDNHASNAILKKHLKFHRRAYIEQRSAYYNIYIK